jgi:AraC family L-rhamnose operon transcriptional activator RhaR
MVDAAPRLLASRSLFGPSAVRIHVNRPVHEGDTPLHCHDFLELAFVISGRAVHRTIAGLKPVSGGEVFIVSPGQWHAFESCRDLRTYNCVIGMDLMQRELAWTTSDHGLGRLLARASDRQDVLALRLAPDSLPTCTACLERLRELQSDPHPGTRPIQLGNLLVLLGEIARHQSQIGGEVGAKPAHPVIAEAMTIMAEDLRRPWSITALARRLDMNPSYFSRCFDQCTGLSPMNWLIRQRGEQAAILLLTTQQPIAAIGREVGWDDPAYFARRFRAIFGQTPKDYRKQLPCPALPQTPDEWIQW